MLASVDLPFRITTRSFHCCSAAKNLLVHGKPRVALRKVASTMSVQEYIDKHDLSKKVEEVINACVKAKPEEPISFMVQPHNTSSRSARRYGAHRSELPFIVMI